MKKNLILILVMVLLCSNVFASGTKENSSNEEIVKIKLAGITPPEHPETLTMYKFAEVLKTLSGGRFICSVFPNNQLGTPEAFLDSLRKGSIEMAVAGTELAVHQPLLACSEMPYMFKDYDYARKLLNSDLGKEMVSGLPEKVNIRHLSYIPQGFRVLSSLTPIEKFEDLKGMRIRSPNIPLYIEFFKSIGASPQALPFAELYTALEQKVVSGCGNPYSTIQSMKLDEVLPYTTDTRHILIIHNFLINNDFYEGLTDEYRGWLDDAVKQATDYCWDITIEKENEAIKYLENNGIKIIYPDAEFMAKMKNAMSGYREFFYKKYSGSEEFLEKVDKFN